MRGAGVRGRLPLAVALCALSLGGRGKQNIPFAPLRVAALSGEPRLGAAAVRRRLRCARATLLCAWDGPAANTLAANGGRRWRALQCQLACRRRSGCVRLS
jgi:hypothetical protein